MKNKTCYIAGPMRGYPRYNFDAFDAARDVLIKEGWAVISPADLDRQAGFDPDNHPVTAELLREIQIRDVAAIFNVDMVFVLDGWATSKGATAEICVAKWRDIPVLSFTDRQPIKILPIAAKEEPKEKVNEEDVLEEALRLTTGDRNNSYGPPTQDFGRTAAMWSAILGCEVKAKQVALCMIALKLSRATWASKRDNWTDIAGYARCGYLCEQAE
jgi:hypothetical protein